VFAKGTKGGGGEHKLKAVLTRNFEPKSRDGERGKKKQPEQREERENDNSPSNRSTPQKVEACNVGHLSPNWALRGKAWASRLAGGAGVLNGCGGR